MVTVQFTQDAAGRTKGTKETLADETLAQAWEEAGVAKIIHRDEPQPDPPAKTGAPRAEAPDKPAVNRAVPSPKPGRG